jgi:tetrapyrrole methylase family protein/MazG family protein
MRKKENIGTRFERLVEILTVLRSEHGCPWDREQDERTIVNYFLEEVFEATDAALADDSPSLQEELGDVMMEVVFLAQIYKEKGLFTIADVLDGIIAKMIRRHPHVFEGQKQVTSREVVERWQEHKYSEKKRESVIEGLPRSAPALLQAYQVGQRAASVGFDWEAAPGVLDNDSPKIREEIGDLLFSLASLSRLAGHNPELALRESIGKFQRRFRAMEKELKSLGLSFDRMNTEEMDLVWERIKKKPL